MNENCTKFYVVSIPFAFKYTVDVVVMFNLSACSIIQLFKSTETVCMVCINRYDILFYLVACVLPYGCSAQSPTFQAYTFCHKRLCNAKYGMVYDKPNHYQRILPKTTIPGTVEDTPIRFLCNLQWRSSLFSTPAVPNYVICQGSATFRNWKGVWDHTGDMMPQNLHDQRKAYAAMLPCFKAS